MARDTPRILFALTSHGLGHATRSLAIARALRECAPSIEIIVASALPPERIALDLPGPVEHRFVDYEPGVLQRSCFEIDLPGTRRAYRERLEQRDALLEREIAGLRESRCTAVVSDIPALPVRAAAQLGIPAYGIANFTWDWILAPLFSQGDEVVEQLTEDYRQGTLHLVLPFGPETSSFPRCEPAPLVCRRAQLGSAELRRRIGLPEAEERSLVVVCPGGWTPDAWPAIQVPDCEGMRFVTVGDLPIRADAPMLALPHQLPSGVTFPDLVAAADVVLAKPGYGIASECAVHRTPLVSIERPDFRESPLLVAAFRALGPGAELSLADFFAGRWEAALRDVLDGESSWAPLPADGAAQVARRLAELLELDGHEEPPA